MSLTIFWKTHISQSKEQAEMYQFSRCRESSSLINCQSHVTATLAFKPAFSLWP
ncbi:cytochrome p450 [Moniliophthora roreri]|nr:cytochrome p450 [Moniliophthora roreri]